jgi:nucleotide-binding universal stress UspA family protein
MQTEEEKTEQTEEKNMRILIATGGATHSELAVRQVALLPLAGQSAVTVLTVVKHEEDKRYAEGILAHAVDLLQNKVGRVHGKVRIGQPAEEIVLEGEEYPYDLIVMGQRPSHRLLVRVLGAVTKQVLQRTSRSVLIAKAEARKFDHILLCDSGVQSPPLLQLLRLRLPALLTEATDVTVLHVMSQISASPGASDRDLHASAEELIAEHTPEGELLERNVQMLQQMALEPRPKVRHGLVVDEILEEARSGNYDLVVIGGHRPSDGVPRFLLDDLAWPIAEHIRRGVLVVR